MAHSHCTGLGLGLGPGQGPGPETMGYYILCRIVQLFTTPELGQGQEAGNLSMCFQPNFQDLKYFPVVLCNGFQLHAQYFQVSFPFPVPVQCEHYAPVPFPIPVPVQVPFPFLCSVNVPLGVWSPCLGGWKGTGNVSYSQPVQGKGWESQNHRQQWKNYLSSHYGRNNFQLRNLVQVDP